VGRGGLTFVVNADTPAVAVDKLALVEQNLRQAEEYRPANDRDRRMRALNLRQLNDARVRLQAAS
jgi:hypothetical protein